MKDGLRWGLGCGTYIGVLFRALGLKIAEISSRMVRHDMAPSIRGIRAVISTVNSGTKNIQKELIDD